MVSGAWRLSLLLEHADAVLVANMLGNGVSSSPSTCAAYPPVVTVDDQARALRRLPGEARGRGLPRPRARRGHRRTIAASAGPSGPNAVRSVGSRCRA